MRVNLRFCAAAVVLATLSGCIFEKRDERPATIDAKAQVVTKYVFRGQVMNDRGAVQGDLNTGLPTIGGGLLNLGAFGNMDIDQSAGDAWFGDNNEWQFTELRLHAMYEHTFLELITADIGIRPYIYPYADDFPNSLGTSPEQVTETFLGTRVDLFQDSNLFSFSPYGRINYEIDDLNYWYGQLGIGKTLEILDRLSVTGDASFGMGDRDHNVWLFGPNPSGVGSNDRVDSGITDVLLSLQLDYILDDEGRVGAFAAVDYTGVVDEDLRDRQNDTNRIDTDNVLGRFGISLAF